MTLKVGIFDGPQAGCRQLSRRASNVCRATPRRERVRLALKPISDPAGVHRLVDVRQHALSERSYLRHASAVLRSILPVSRSKSFIGRPRNFGESLLRLNVVTVSIEPCKLPGRLFCSLHDFRQTRSSRRNHFDEGLSLCHRDEFWLDHTRAHLARCRRRLAPGDRPCVPAPHDPDCSTLHLVMLAVEMIAPFLTHSRTRFRPSNHE